MGRVVLVDLIYLAGHLGSSLKLGLRLHAAGDGEKLQGIFD